MLLLINFFLLKENSKIIDENKEALQTAASVKVKLTEVISNLHLLDLGIRGYALVESKQIEGSYDSAINRWPRIQARLEYALKEQGFPSKKILLLKDTVASYINWVISINHQLKTGNRQQAIEMIREDRGYHVWLFHNQLTNEINLFEDRIEAAATIKYHAGLRNSYLLQLALFLLILPTLIYLYYYTIQSFKLSEKLLASEAEKNKILFTQKEILERMVDERTREIATQNEEIVSQNEEIHTHNEKLLAQQTEIEKQSLLLKTRNLELEEANALIAQQNQIIENENLQLSFDLDRQNKELLQSNHELAQKNSRMEQFAYVVSHNLRAPIARLTGLTNIFKFAKSDSEIEDIVKKTNQSAQELDQVVKGLSEVMQIQRLSADVFSEVQFESVIEKVKDILDAEIKETKAEFKIQLEVESIYSLPPYIESVFYNLISNGIKYRNPERRPIVTIDTKKVSDFVCLSFLDNGLGLELGTYKDQLFGLYKRFHFHVEGRGLGLYLVKTQIEMLGGKIEVESKPLEGTAFKVYLPSKN